MGQRFERLPGWAKIPAVLGWLTWLRVRRATVEPRRLRPSYCAALAGESDYDICINSDMTVSCNCRDFDGRGHIGDLRQQDLAEIFDGPVVRRFQETLAEGRLPTDVCRICPERRPLPPGRTAPAEGRVPKQGIMVENTAACNLRCHLCKRDELLSTRRSLSLSPEDVARVARMLEKYGVERVCYFALGEPFISPRILDEVRTIRERTPSIRIITSTNGALLDTDEKLSAALSMDYVFVSIDGVDQDTLGRYQVGGDFDRSLRNLTRLVERRAEAGREIDGALLPVLEWKYVMFRWNDRPEHVRRALELARAAGVDRMTFVPGEAPMRNMSFRYFCDPILRSEGRPTDSGVLFEFNEVPDHLL